MIRPDGNRIALRVVRAILGAAHDFEVELAGKAIHVRSVVQAAPPWPRALDGLDAVVDAPWPTPVVVEASWEGGSSRLLVACDSWAADEKWRHAVSLSVSLVATRRHVLWITVVSAVTEAADADVVPVRGAVALAKPFKGEDPVSFESYFPALRAVAAGAGVPMLSPAMAHICDVAVPTGEILPDPATAFRRAVTVAIAKHPWFERRDRLGFTGVPFVDVVYKLADTKSMPAPPTNSASHSAHPDRKRAGIWPLPGGVRAYVGTLRSILADINTAGSLSIPAFEALFDQRYQAKGKTAIKGYRGVLRSLGFAEESGGEVALTPAGRQWLDSASQDALFKVLHSRFIGILEPLVLAEMAPALARIRVRDALHKVLQVDWQSGNQVDFRRNWLLSLGATERTATGDAVTPFGRGILLAHADEVTEIRAALAGILEEPPDVIDDGSDDGVVEVPPEDSAAPSEIADAPGWFETHAVLTASTIAENLGPLRFSRRILDQLSAAISAGKHILLVGPPGTGKTELAVALARAAKNEGYCAGHFTATASADWTTFDTIGGYALQAQGHFAFRPGAFLRAVEQKQWLIVDELNRADVDRAFGELMTVLAGQGTDTHYEHDGRLVTIGPEEGRTFRVPRSFRVLATMNTWDKTSLFRLSYAVQRRFAIVTIGIPDDVDYRAILESVASDTPLIPPLTDPHLSAVLRLFSRVGLLELREIGPAVGCDVVRYLRRRGDSADGLAEATEMFVLPQLHGIGDAAAKLAMQRCVDAVGTSASDDAKASLRARFTDLFPSLGATNG